MSSSVSALSIFQGVVRFVAGANPSCLWVKAGYTLNKSPAHRGSYFGDQYLAQGHFDTQLSSAWGSWDLNQQPSDH